MKILIADDNHVMRMALADILTKEKNWRVIETSDGQEAWEKMSRGLRPHVCILDIAMPRMDGLTVLQKIREDERLKKTSVILITLDKERDTVVKAASLGVSAYILKPYNASKVLEQVRKVAHSIPPENLEEIVLIAPDQVMASLGVGTDRYFDLLDMLLRDLEVSVPHFENLLPEEVKGIVGACLTLGASEIAEALEQQEPDKKFLDECLKRLQDEKKRIEIRYNRPPPSKREPSTAVSSQHYRENQLQKLELYMVNIGMTLEQDVKTQDGMVLVARGQQVDFRIWKRLQNFYYSTTDPKPVLVKMPPQNLFGGGPKI